MTDDEAILYDALITYAKSLRDQSKLRRYSGSAWAEHREWLRERAARVDLIRMTTIKAS